jgi:hypothetical protein
VRKVYEDAVAVELVGLALVAYYNALGVHRRIAREALKRAGIDEPNPGAWYRRQIILDVLQAIEHQGDCPTLFQVGKELAIATALPPEVTRFEQVLEASPAIYPQYQRNLPEHDYIRVTRDGAAWLYIYHTPWPSQTIRGFLWEMFFRFRPGQRFQIELVQGAEDDFERTFCLAWDP